MSGDQAPTVDASHPVPFILLFDGRVGSTHLSSLLDSHPEIVMRMEILGRMIGRAGVDARSQLEVVRELYGRKHRSRPKAVGFKTKLRDVLDIDELAAILRSVDARVLYLRRVNEVKGAVSAALGDDVRRQTGDWNLSAGDQPVPRRSIPARSLQLYLARRAALDAFTRDYIRDLGQPVLELTYEQLLLDEAAVLDEVVAFLGVGTAPMRSEWVKATSDDLRDVLDNFDELRGVYAGTRFEPMFDEVLQPGHAHPPAGSDPEPRGGSTRVRARALARRVRRRLRRGR